MQPSEQQLLSHFVERIMNIDPTMGNMFGQGYPGFQGSTAIMGGSGNAAEVIGKLRHATTAFTVEFRKEEPSRPALLKAAEYIEAGLTVLQTLSVLQPAATDELLAELHSLIDYRTIKR